MFASLGGVTSGGYHRIRPPGVDFRKAALSTVYTVTSSVPAGGGGLVGQAGGDTRPAYLNPKETSMEEAINQGGVTDVSVSKRGSGTMHLVSVYIHHELTAEKAAELVDLVEKVAIHAIKTWVTA